MFEDTSGNGVRDPTEVGLPGAAIAVTCDAGPGCIAGTVYSMVTAADGSFGCCRRHQRVCQHYSERYAIGAVHWFAEWYPGPGSGNTSLPAPLTRTRVR